MYPKNTASSSRLPKAYGLLIDRSKPLSFSFEKQVIKGFEGDTIASALIAEGHWLMSRSFKYHRPRGPLTMAGQDANTLVQLPSAPNTLADKKNVQQDLVVEAQNFTGSLRYDLQAFTGLLSRFLPVGFYYKAFFRPKGIWELWAPFIRKQSGLGKIDESFEPTYFDKQYKFADVLVIGGGPAGLSAGLEAAKTGVDVMIIDENPVLGGSLNYARFDEITVAAKQLRQSLIEQVESAENIEVLTSTTVNSWHADNWLALVAENRLYKVRAKEVVACTGSLEQQAVFRGNDIPGVVMSSAAQRLVHLYGIKPGNCAVILTGNNEGYATALDLMEAGVCIKAVVDMRAEPVDTALYRSIVRAGITIHQNSTVYEAFMDRRAQRIKKVDVRSIISRGKCSSSKEIIDCDLLCMSIGYVPTYQLICQAGGQLSYDDESCAFTLNNYPEHFSIAGSVNGKWGLDDVLAEGSYTGAIAAANVKGETRPITKFAGDDPLAQNVNFDWPMFSHPKGKEFVDFDEDLQIKDIVNATREGYEHIQLVKRYSTCGMGPSQGRHSALAAARLVAEATGRTVADIGVTTARPPFAAELIAHNAGRSFYPVRRTNMHYRHIEAGAQMMLAGEWYRPAYYSVKPSSSDEVINAEVINVRKNVGLIDVSTLGGIEVRGPDAAIFLNRFYTFAFVKQSIGQARYALLTNDAGVVIDDGVACRFQKDHFYVTATTGGVGRVHQSMLKWNAQWRMDVDITNVTTAWCGVNLAGPHSRTVLAKVCDDIKLSREDFPYMGVRTGTLSGIPARIIRVGFVGELGYEIHVPQQYGEQLWDLLIQAGEAMGIKPFGVEAQRILRLEKGHVIIGQDTDAMTNPIEVQMAWAIARKKPFFVGARTIRELEKKAQTRALVGFSIQTNTGPQPQESHLVLEGETMIGRVTSCAYSATLDKIVGLAYVSMKKSEPGSIIEIKSSKGVRVSAEVTALPFYDAKNKRQAL
jgi:sarcosine oxidase subunit alpha